MSEFRPVLMRCAVCNAILGVPSLDVSLPAPVLPAHAYQPGYKCFGSGAPAVMLGRGEVLAPPPEAEAEAKADVRVSVGKRWRDG